MRLLLGLLGDLRGLRVADIGCGDGALAVEMARRGAEVTGADPDPAQIAAARCRAEAAGLSIRFLCAPAEALPLPGGCMDRVVAVTALCFTAEPARALAGMAHILRPGGRLVLGELGRWNLWAAIRRLRGWRGHPVWRAARFHDAAALRGLVRGAGLHVVALRGAVFYPPVGPLARAMRPLDPALGRITTLGAAFLGLAAEKPARHARPGHDKDSR